MPSVTQILLALVGPALCLLVVPTGVHAKYLRETPADIVAMPGMPVALGVCLAGILLLRFAPVADADTLRPAAVPAPRPSRWAVVGVFVVFIFATVPVGFQIASAIVVQIGHAAWRNSINTVGVILALLFLRYVFRQRELRRWSVVTSLVLIAAAYAYFFTVLEVPVKRIHFMEYSLLSYLVYRALRPHSAPPRIYLWCVLAAMLVGMGEEALSIPIARRFGAVSDVIWDTSGGLLGTLVLKYVLLKR
jgi:VanZ family protein